MWSFTRPGVPTTTSTPWQQPTTAAAADADAGEDAGGSGHTVSQGHSRCMHASLCICCSSAVLASAARSASALTNTEWSSANWRPAARLLLLHASAAHCCKASMGVGGWAGLAAAPAPPAPPAAATHLAQHHLLCVVLRPSVEAHSGQVGCLAHVLKVSMHLRAQAATHTRAIRLE
jgi:hypothetical protein